MPEYCSIMCNLPEGYSIADVSSLRVQNKKCEPERISESTISFLVPIGIEVSVLITLIEELKPVKIHLKVTGQYGGKFDYEEVPVDGMTHKVECFT